MKARRHLSWKVWVFAALPLAVLAGPIVVLSWLEQRSIVDYSTKPPAAVFEEVMGKPVPAGVSILKVAGRSHPITNVWLRLHITDAGIASLVANKQPLEKSDPERAKARRSDCCFKSPFAADDLRSVGWSEVAQIKKPETYEFSTIDREPNAATGWDGEIIVDRSRHLIWMHAMSPVVYK